MALRLSILDQSPVPEGLTASDALRNSIDLAQLADHLGYDRYWVAEHHGTPGLACNSPEVLIGPLAAATSRIRVGSGGIMLPHYSPLKVAASFSMLSALFPGRIDLGIGRAPGTSGRVALALQRDRRHAPPDDFAEQLSELLGYLENRPPANSPFLPLESSPAIRFESPQPWLLGSSLQSAVWAAELGLPYVFADFINSEGAGIARHYRQNFRPSLRLAQPRMAVAAWVICAESDAEALRLSFSLRMMSIQLFRGRLIPVPAVQRAEVFLRNEGMPPEMLPVGRRIITGSPSRVRAAVEAVAQEYGADEVLLVNILHNHAARRLSYELVADAFGLSESATGRTELETAGRPA